MRNKKRIKEGNNQEGTTRQSGKANTIKIDRKTKSKIKLLGMTILFSIMVVLVFQVSPILTNVIQNTAKILYELNAEDITRVVQLILSVFLPLAVLVIKTSKEDEE